MNLLGAKLYDPSSAASKVTTSLLAMTAIDTTNLRIAFTIPAHGFVRVRLYCIHHGATTMGQILLGVMDGANIRGRVSANGNQLLQTAIASTRIGMLAEFVVPGLTPGAVSWDAAYGVEIIASASGAIKYGGPNNTTTDDAFGAFVFEVWDPQPMTTTGQLSVDANGRVDVIKVAGTTQTARDLGASVLLSPGTGTGQLDVTSGVVKANVAQLLGTAWLTPGTAGTPDVNVKLWNALTTVELPLVPTTAGRKLDVSAGGEAGVDWANIGSPTTAQNLSATNIDVDQVVASVSGAVGSVTGLTASDVAAIKTKTDGLTFTVSNQLDCNIESVNAIQVIGNGTLGNPWNPV